MNFGFTRGGRKKENERIDALEKAVDGLESAQRLIKTEWLDVHDRLNRVMGRLTARIRKSEALTEPESSDQPDPEGVAPPPGPVAVTGSHALLSAARAKRRGR